MKENDSRIALRLPAKERERIDRLVEAGKFKSLSHLIRVALSEFLRKVE